MRINTQVALCTLAIVLPVAFAGCSSGPPSAPPATSSPSAVNAQTQTTTPTTPTPASNAVISFKGKVDPCQLLTGDEIKAVQGDTLKDTKASEQSSGPFVTTQCFYTTSNFVNSISLTLTQKNPATSGESIREFWEDRFGREEHEKGRGKDRKKEREREREREGQRGEEEEEEGLPPQRVKSLGDEAFWVGNTKIGALYVLKGEKFLRISIGGAHTQEVRTEKMKSLALNALKRL